MSQLPEKKRPSKEQLRILLDYIEDNPTLIPGIVTTANIHVWKDLARALNSVSGGLVQEINGWLTCWTNMKSTALQTRLLLPRSCNEKDAVPVSPYNVRIRRIVDEYQTNDEAEKESVRDKSPIHNQRSQTPCNSHSLYSETKRTQESPYNCLASSKSSLLQSSGKKESLKKKAPLKFSGFRFLLSIPERYKHSKSEIIGLTKKEVQNKGPQHSLSTPGSSSNLTPDITIDLTKKELQNKGPQHSLSTPGSSSNSTPNITIDLTKKELQNKGPQHSLSTPESSSNSTPDITIDLTKKKYAKNVKKSKCNHCAIVSNCFERQNDAIIERVEKMISTKFRYFLGKLDNHYQISKTNKTYNRMEQNIDNIENKMKCEKENEEDIVL